MKILKSYCLAIILTILAFQRIIDAVPEADADALDTLNININIEGAKDSGSEAEEEEAGLIQAGKANMGMEEIRRPTWINTWRKPTWANTWIPSSTTTTTSMSTTTSNSPDPILCGVKKKSKVTKYIVNGTETQVNEYPWIVEIGVENIHGETVHHCGGSVIADKWILTAAHCIVFAVEDVSLLSRLTVVIGEHNIEDDTETNITKRLKAEKIFLHPDYEENMDGTNKIDIGLIKIPKIDLRIYTPICLPVPGAEYTGKRAWVYGWGSIRSDGPLSPLLQHVEVPVISDAEGRKLYDGKVMNVSNSSKVPIHLTDEELAVMIFAGGEGYKGVCYGDSGGPLSYANPDNNGRHEQIGIVSFGVVLSFGLKCGDLPAVFAEVSALRNFIDETIDSNGGASFGTE